MKIAELIGSALVAFVISQAVCASPPSDLISKARSGDIAAELRLGEIYEEGRDGDKDYAQAAYWVKRAAEQGDPAAQAKLGRFFSEGIGVAVDHSQALKWYQKAAKKGNPVAEFNLGRLYSRGKGTPVNPSKALLWYRRAAEGGNADATASLAVLYEEGNGTPRNEVLAFALLLIAADQGSEFAHKRLYETEKWKRFLSYADRGEAMEIEENWRTKKVMPKSSKSSAVPFASLENGDTLKITGPIKEGAFNEIKKLYSSTIKKIYVNSIGGNGFEGIKIAELIGDKDLTVVVDGVCISSCANYIFLAARNKVVEPNSIICFHGGFPDNIDDYRAMITDDETSEQVKSGWKIMDKYARRQAEFLSSKGIDKTLLAFRAEVSIPGYATSEYKSYKAQFGVDESIVWCPSPDELSKFGVHVDNMWYPSNVDDLIELGKKYSVSLIAASKRVD